MNNPSDETRQIRLSQLQELYAEGLLNEEAYRLKLEDLQVDPDTILAPAPPPDLPALRERLNRP